jgi:hypothetical protein
LNTRKTQNGDEPEVGRFHALMQEAAPARRAPYQLTRELALPMPTAKQVRAFRNAITEEDRLEALVGEHISAIEEMFDNEPYDVYQRFLKDYYDHFFGQGAADVPGGSEGS